MEPCVLSEGVSRAVCGRLSSPGVQPLLVMHALRLPGPPVPAAQDCQPGSGEQARAAAGRPLKPGHPAARGCKVSQRSSPSVLQGEPRPPRRPVGGGLHLRGRPGAHPGFWRECFRSWRPASHPSSQPSTRSTILSLFCPLSDFFSFS